LANSNFSFSFATIGYQRGDLIPDGTPMCERLAAAC